MISFLIGIILGIYITRKCKWLSNLDIDKYMGISPTIEIVRFRNGTYAVRVTDGLPGMRNISYVDVISKTTRHKKYGKHCLVNDITDVQKIKLKYKEHLKNLNDKGAVVDL